DLQKAFNDLLSRLEEAFERQRRFTGDASHQLRTPLTALRGEVEVALRRDRPAEEYRAALAQARDRAVRLGQIVEAMLFLARADAEADLAALETLDLAAVVPEQLRRWEGHARAADLHHKAGPGPIEVRAQAVLLGQLLDNLVDNALRYSDPGSPVMVELSVREGSAVLAGGDGRAGGWGGGGWGAGGRGSGRTALPPVLEPFYRTAASRRRGVSGAGLGLAVVRRIAQAFGGSVSADSAPGQGSCFVVRLPLAPSGAPV